MGNDKWLNNIGRIIKKKNGGHFLVFERRRDKNKEYVGESPFPLTVNEGDIFQMKPKLEDLAKLIKDGKIDEETAKTIAQTVRFEISKAPDSGSEKKTDKTTKSDPDDEVNF